MDVSGRIDRLRARFDRAGSDGDTLEIDGDGLDGAGIEALLVTSLTNLRYLTGFSGTAGMLLVGPDSATLFTDGRYRTQSARQLAEAGVKAEIEIGRPSEQRERLVEASASFARIGLEAEQVSWSTQRSLAKAFADDDVAHELVATEGLVGALRRVKDPGELERLQVAAAIADEALARVLHLLVPGVTEATLASALDHQMRELGASDRSFETIVASGPNSAMPHARPSARQIQPGELVVIDFGAIFDGYCSDMTRTFCIGEPSSRVLEAVVEVVANAQLAGVSAVVAGVEAAEVDRACREVVAAAGWDTSFMHGTGHGVGLEVHEAPSVGPRSTDKLDESCVVTVEPGVYLPGHGGARIEDTVVVTSHGCRVLTRAPKGLVVAPA